MAAMDRETLVRILAQAPGVSGNEPRFDIAEDHRLTLYLGSPGRAMEVADIRSIAIEADFVCIDNGEDGFVYCGTDDVHAVSVKPTRPKSNRRAGFS